MRDIVSLTPMAEYMDALYVSLTQSMKLHPETEWWIELHPPKEEDDIAGSIVLRAREDKVSFRYEAGFRAVQMGATVELEQLTTVVDHHVTKFMENLA